MGKHKAKPNYRRRSLRLPDLDHCKRAVLNSLGSPASRRVYEYAIDQFIAWYCSEPRLAFNRIVVVRYRIYLESRSLAANTINQQLAAVRRLAYEAADAGLLSPELAAGISRAKGVKQLGFRFRQLVERRTEFGRAAASRWRNYARETRLRHAGHAIRLWFSEVGVGRAGIGRDSKAPRSLGGGGPDRQRWSHPHGTYSLVGQGGARSLDDGRENYRGANLPSRSEDGQGVGQRYLTECGLVRGPGLLRTSGVRAHSSARPAANVREAMPRQRWGARADSVLAGTCVCVNYRTLSWLQAEPRASG